MRKGPTPRYEMWWKKSRLYAYLRLRKYGQRVQVIPAWDLWEHQVRPGGLVMGLHGTPVPGITVQLLADDGREVIVAVDVPR